MAVNTVEISCERDEEFVKRVCDHLIETYGVSGFVRFIRHFMPLEGDYTEERRELLKDVTPEQLLAELRKIS